MWLIFLLSLREAASIELQNLVLRVFYDGISRFILNLFDLN